MFKLVELFFFELSSLLKICWCIYGVIFVEKNGFLFMVYMFVFNECVFIVFY